MSLRAARAAAESDAVLGARPAVVYEPSTVEEASLAVAESAREGGGQSLVFVGGATELELGAPPSRLDAILRTGRLDRVLEHAPSDQIVVAEAGVTLAALAAVLAAHGQRLALDPPSPERATVGGVVASNAFGPLRARYGSVRDLIIGISIIRADGRMAHGGGKVVKNVAGFDLPKLMVGSLGTLGLIATATFRLHPLPEDGVTLLSARRGAAEIGRLVARMRESQLEPAAVIAFGLPDGRFDLAVRFEGFGRGVLEQRDRFTALASAEEGVSCEALDAAAARDLWARHDGARRAGSLRAKVAMRPARSAETSAAALAPLLASLENPAGVLYPTLGLGFASGDVRDPDAAAAAVGAARSRLAAEGGSLVLHAAPETLRSRVDVWGEPPPAIGLLRSVKSRLDPARRLAPGRFVGGI